MASHYSYLGTPPKRFLPIVCDEFHLACALDILLLCKELSPIIQAGDLDNRIKTLFDALRIPKLGEDMSGDEDPLYCLMTDDKLISELRVTADHLFAEPDQVIENPKVTSAGEYKISKDHVCAIIHVLVKPIQVTKHTADFL